MKKAVKKILETCHPGYISLPALFWVAGADSYDERREAIEELARTRPRRFRVHGVDHVGNRERMATFFPDAKVYEI